MTTTTTTAALYIPLHLAIDFAMQAGRCMAQNMRSGLPCDLHTEADAIRYIAGFAARAHGREVVFAPSNQAEILSWFERIFDSEQSFARAAA
jgi:hypothetical protein